MSTKGRIRRKQRALPFPQRLQLELPNNAFQLAPYASRCERGRAATPSLWQVDEARILANQERRRQHLLALMREQFQILNGIDRDIFGALSANHH